VKFCNYDSVTTGTCELCESFTDAMQCDMDTLPAKGSADCKTWCFAAGSTATLATAPATATVSGAGKRGQDTTPTLLGVRFVSTGTASDGTIGLRPVIQALGSNPLVITNRDSSFDDGGARCVDSVDGDISETITASGVSVDLRDVGKYSLTYSCTNAKGIRAKPLVKVVAVVPLKGGTCACDNTCPYARDGHCMDAGPGSFGTHNITHHQGPNHTAAST
jgi:hypothetical protein